MTRVTVYVPCHDYGRYVDRAIESVLAQRYEDWELLVVDDGSTDDSWSVIQQHTAHERVRTWRNDTPVGLRAVANQCIAAATGEFVLRLDADDMLHPYCLEIMTGEVERRADVVMVFSDYLYVDEHDQVLGVECLPRVGADYAATTFAPHGAGSLVQRSVFDQLGGYDESLARQDGQELWLKVLQAGWAYAHVPLPLFSYRKHGPSLSSDLPGVLADRAALRRSMASGQQAEPVVAMIPVRNTYPDMPGIPFRRIHGQTLLEQTVTEAVAVPAVTRVVVSTDSDDVVEWARDNLPEVEVVRRPPGLADPNTSMVEIVEGAADEVALGEEQVIVLLSVHTPRRTRQHIAEALDTFFLYPVDAVVSVHEERGLIYLQGTSGLRAMNPTNEDRLRLERDAVYVDSGAVRVFRRRSLRSGRLVSGRIGHTLMSVEDAVQIKSPRDFHLLDPGVGIVDQA